MKTITATSQFWRALLVIPISVMAVLSIVATGGSSGGDDDGFDDDIPEVPPIILSTYNFEIGSTDSTVDVPLTVGVGNIAEISVSFGNTILGSIDLDVSATGDVEVLSTVTDAGSTFSLAASVSEPALSAGVAVTVTQDISAFAFEVPASGAFEITTDPPTGAITVTILPFMEVQISLNDGMPATYSWEALGELLVDPLAQDHERVAALTLLAYEFLFERVFEVVDVLDELEEVRLAGSIVEQCDVPRVPLPADLLAEGQAALILTGPVVFLAEFLDCWADAPFDTLLRGEIQLANYIEEIDASNRLTRIGFGPNADTRGGVMFFGFRIDEAEEVNGVFVIDPSSSIEVSGGFSLVFTAL
jgi:hypothetical protein